MEPVAGVLAQVRRLGEDLDDWAALIHEEQTPHGSGVGVRVLIDQAEDLRRRLRQVGDTCRGLLLGQAQPRHGVGNPPDPAVTGVWPGRSALVAAATSLHAGAHGIGPSASTLCEQDHLLATMSSSAQITGRFLTTATGALQEASTLDPPRPAGTWPGRPPARSGTCSWSSTTPASMATVALPEPNHPANGRATVTSASHRLVVASGGTVPGELTRHRGACPSVPGPVQRNPG
ncbi:hypothetical protein ACQE98_15985 [Ornithinimicrobium sp. W1679]|uniref:hypothetical protein n=1 Tax=Ornithinimicrobium sp. W1679 TaxID=3418770 RepID=UPI003CEE33EA